MIRILLLVDCANDFDRNLLRGIVRYSRENGPWLFYRLPSYYKSIENGERSILEWAKTWKADAIIGQWNDDAMDLLKELNGQNVTVDGTYPVEVLTEVLPLLQHAQHNEFQEFDPVYPQFGQIAAQEGFTQAAAAFQQIAKIEKTHGERFGLFAQWMESGKLFVNETSTKWMCLNCGHIQNSLEAPKQCPVCNHGQGWFIRLELAPWSPVAKQT